MEASKAGSDFIKVFPCAQVGGGKCIKALRSALPQIPLIAAGGLTQNTADGFILAGTTALGVRAELIHTDAIEHRDSEWIQQLAQRFLGFVRKTRQRLALAKV